MIDMDSACPAEVGSIRPSCLMPPNALPMTEEQTAIHTENAWKIGGLGLSAHIAKGVCTPLLRIVEILAAIAIAGYLNIPLAAYYLFDGSHPLRIARLPISRLRQVCLHHGHVQGIENGQ